MTVYDISKHSNIFLKYYNIIMQLLISNIHKESAYIYIIINDIKVSGSNKLYGVKQCFKEN